MLEKTRLEELSIALPEKERRELLDRINRRMEREDSEEAVPVELREDEREKIISYEMKRASPWVRFLVWVRSLFSGRRPREVFVDVRLRLLRSRIRAASPGLTSFDTRGLTPRFARRLWELHQRLRPLLEPYRALATDRGLRAAAYTFLVERRLAGAKRTVGEFMPDEEMEDIFADTSQAEEIRKRLATRMSEYIRSVPETLIGQLEDQCGTHLALARLTAFPFAGLFRYFNHVLDEGGTERPPAFEHAPALLVLDLLEKLYVPLVLVRRLGPDPAWAPEPLGWWLLTRSGEPPRGELDLGSVEGELARLRAQLVELCREMEVFDRAIPLLDLVRFFRRDPWYNLVFHTPRLYLKSLYATALKARVGAELEGRLGSIRERVVKRRIAELLKQPRMVELPNYKSNPGFDHAALGLPTFQYVRSLTLLYNYLLAQYKGAVQEAVQLLMTTALANNRITQNRLGQFAATLEDLEARIVQFDRSLAPDEDDGKQLARFRFTMAADSLQQKAYRGFVAQKDREARELIDRGIEGLVGVRKVTDEVRTSAFENTRSLLKALHAWKGRSQTLGQILTARSEGIAAFLKLLDQLIELEKGS